MRRIFHLGAVMAFAICAQVKLLAQVKVWEGTMTLPTYEEGPPDPNPPFDQFAGNKFNYPYVLRENLTSRRVSHEWRAIYLENKYLKCSVLPDIGGHLYTCIDKISGHSMFYDNTAIKKAAVGYRGAWAAFGIEFNFPVSHNWVSMSPVDFAFQKNGDGSASVFVGNIDRVYGMEWQVELVLRPGSTLLEERVSLSNRSDVRHRFYWWNNAAARVSDDSRIVYPMRYAASHGFTEVRPWPLDPDGSDLSVIRNHTHGAVSYFAYGTREEFMGVWHPATKTGTVHFARYEDLPAKKIWSWGVDEEGLDWRKALSDDNSAYIEIQAGLFRNQETYAFLQPRQSIHFSEYWMPVRGLDGISRANLAGVVSLSRGGDKLRVGIDANLAVPHASISILKNTTTLFNEVTDLTPETTWSHELEISDVQAKYTVEVKDAKGAILIRQTEDKYDWTPDSEIHVGPQPAYRIPEPDKRNCDEWLQLGKDLELDGKNLQALDVYRETLKRYPDSFAAAKSFGRLAAALLRYQESKDLLGRIKPRDTTDPELSYYLGVAYDGLGESKLARDEYEQARHFGEFRAASSLRLGEMLARAGDLRAAEGHLTQAHLAAPDDLRITEELIAVKNAAGNKDEAKRLATEELARSPQDYFLREELGQPDLRQLGNDANRVLNIATQYMRLGLYQRALDVLSREYPAGKQDETELDALPPAKHPMLAYFRGYCRGQLGQSPQADYQQAATLSTSYVFPSTAEELTVLQSAVETNNDDATAHYLLGMLYFSRGMIDPALKDWSQARKVNPNIPVLDASLGQALLHEKDDPVGAVAAFRDGLAGDATNVAIYLGADQALSILNKPTHERIEVLEKYPDMADAPSELVFELILNLAESGLFKEADALFRNRFFPREEGGTNVRQVWGEVQLEKLLTLSRNKHCSEAEAGAKKFGAPEGDLAFTRDGMEPIINAARTQYLLGTIHETCGKPEEAKASFQRASTATGPDQMLWAWRASRKLSGFDEQQWRERLKSALIQSDGRSESSSFAGWWYYTAGALEAALGHQQQAEAKFRQALLLPDHMLAYHFTRMARAE
jgi:tetratricopeptide (TPR) repeat protein